MDLFILRHGLAEERAVSTPGSDSQRRLTQEGREKMHRIAAGMKTLELELDLILSSPFLRARETAEIAAGELGLTKLLEFTSALEPDGNSKQLIDDLRRTHPKCAQVLLVSHEPYVSRLVSLLISGDTRIAINFKKGGLCKLSAASLQYGRCATLEWLLTPSQLRKLD